MTTLRHDDRLSKLPLELLSLICLYLGRQDIKSLRLANRTLWHHTKLRLNRVFLSANSLNVAVFRAVANHEILRKQVIEIIWDDAILPSSLADLSRADTDDHSDPELELDDEPEDEEDDADAHTPPIWFLAACYVNKQTLVSRKGNDDENRPENTLKTREANSEISRVDSWTYYRSLLPQQSDTLSTGADVDAFRYGIQRFPLLRRIEITPAAHGWLYTLLYKTPMIRAFPYGFNYVIPRGWPCHKSGYPAREMEPWGTNTVKNEWRGFSIIMQQLAETQHQVSELLINAHHLGTGLNCRLFEGPCTDYDNFTALLQTPNFWRLVLDLEVGGQEKLGWPAFRSMYLLEALAKATNMEHISIRANIDPNCMATSVPSSEISEHHIPLRTIFPIDRWPHLKHFGLLGFLVEQDDLLSLLKALPATIQSVELSFLLFIDNPSSNYKVLLEAMRDELDWCRRDPSTRPKITIGCDLDDPIDGRAIWLQNEIDAFLYYGGDNPFGINGWDTDQPATGMGVVKDEFEPDFERPYVDSNTYIQLGYYPKTS